MTLEDFYFISQIVAALGIMASLIFVGVQIRQSARATRASAAFEATQSWGSLNEQLFANYSDDRMVEGLATYDPTKGWEDFPVGVQTRMTIFNRALLNKLEGQFYLYRYGALDAEIWEARRDWAASMIQLPFHATVWEQDKQDRAYSALFVEALEAARDKSSVKVFSDFEFAEIAPESVKDGVQGQ